jgi:hypothetical protein
MRKTASGIMLVLAFSIADVAVHSIRRALRPNAFRLRQAASPRLGVPRCRAVGEGVVQ